MTDVEQNKRLPLGRISLIFACGTALFSDGYANGVIGSVNTILRRLYPNEIDKHDYSRTLSSLAFAGTVVGMLSFGYLSDRFGRKFGMCPGCPPRGLRVAPDALVDVMDRLAAVCAERARAPTLPNSCRGRCSFRAAGAPSCGL